LILGANHVAISVPDMNQAVDFYCGVLGFEKVMDFGWPVGFDAIDQILAIKGTSARSCMVRTTNLIIELFEFGAGDPAAQNPDRPVIDHGFTHLCLAVTDLDAEYARLREAGMRFHSAPVDPAPGVRTVYGRDPFGNVIELEESHGRIAPHDPVSAAELPPENVRLR
jgi:catechol 2,3-dioxygenase-like lactoylglutathione lyase family enzyme